MSIEFPIIIFLIALPIYFLIRAILKRFDIGSEKNRWLFTFLTTLFLSPLIYVIAITIWIYSISYYPTNYFDREQWLTEKEERFKMSKDIIESGLLIGKTKNDVTKLLGKDYHSYNENHIVYVLGFVPGLMNIDPDVLDI